MKNLMNSFSSEGKNALVVCPERRYGVEHVKGFSATGAKGGKSSLLFRLF